MQTLTLGWDSLACTYILRVIIDTTVYLHSLCQKGSNVYVLYAICQLHVGILDYLMSLKWHWMPTWDNQILPCATDGVTEGSSTPLSIQHERKRLVSRNSWTENTCSMGILKSFWGKLIFAKVNKSSEIYLTKCLDL